MSTKRRSRSRLRRASGGARFATGGWCRIVLIRSANWLRSWQPAGRTLNLQFHHHDAGEGARAAALVVLHAELHLRLPFEELIRSDHRKSYSAAITMDGAPTGALAGSVVVFTGALGMSRNEAAELAARVGMSVMPGVTKETTHLVVGDQDATVLAGHTKSSKHRKAQDMQSAGHPIRIIGKVPSNPSQPNQRQADPPTAWFLPEPERMRGGAAQHFASERHFHRGIHPESTCGSAHEKVTRYQRLAESRRWRAGFFCGSQGIHFAEATPDGSHHRKPPARSHRIHA